MSEQKFTEKCPICGLGARKFPDISRDILKYHCVNCGLYRVNGFLVDTILNANPLDSLDSAKLSYAIRRIQTSLEEYGTDEALPYLDENIIEDLIKSTELPKPPEQMKMMVRWIGDNQPSPGFMVVLHHINDRAQFGAIDKETVRFILTSLSEQGLVEDYSSMGPESTVKLTALGWELYEKLEISSDTTREVFMAMGYGSDAADKAYHQFEDAVFDTGFKLWRLDERPEAGLIDARMIVAIQNAKFVIADLTNQNSGVYWEAGMAHGLGKKVIYTCCESDWEKIHFDTNHYTTVKWKEDDLDEAVENLKASIRATFPLEAKMTD